MEIIKTCQEYCIGCGLCKSELNTEMYIEDTGYHKPSFQLDERTENFLKNVCPASGRQWNVTGDLWGEEKGRFAAFSTNKDIRRRASSGGVLTTLAIFLLEKGYVDAIIHVSVSDDSPIETMCRISTTADEIIERCGSRYAISTPWIELSQVIEEGKKYAAIGKPCDIMALRNLKQYTDTYDNIVYMLSFFCAGLPSKQANERLLKVLGCPVNNCKSLTYRGNGWPGETTAIDNENRKYVLEYSKAWGGILGRDVHPFCKICLDGIGLAADISCGDGWYISEDNTPDFSERDGRNIVFVRTEEGKRMYEDAVKSGVLNSEEWTDVGQLKIIQKYQFTRRTTMRGKILAYRLFNRLVPDYDKKQLKALSKHACMKEKGRIFLGTVKRIIQNKI